MISKNEVRDLRKVREFREFRNLRKTLNFTPAKNNRGPLAQKKL